MFTQISTYTLLLCFSMNVGCTNTMYLKQEEFAQRKEKTEILIFTRDLGRYRFGETGYRIERDSLFGRGLRVVGDGQEVPYKGVIGLSEIDSVRVQELSGGKTVLLIGGIAIVVLIAVAASSSKSSGNSGGSAGAGFGCSNAAIQ